jgi:hypothetical protein
MATYVCCPTNHVCLMPFPRHGTFHTWHSLVVKSKLCHLKDKDVTYVALLMRKGGYERKVENEDRKYKIPRRISTTFKLSY